MKAKGTVAGHGHPSGVRARRGHRLWSGERGMTPTAAVDWEDSHLCDPGSLSSDAPEREVRRELSVRRTQQRGTRMTCRLCMVSDELVCEFRVHVTYDGRDEAGGGGGGGGFLNPEGRCPSKVTTCAGRGLIEDAGDKDWLLAVTFGVGTVTEAFAVVAGAAAVTGA